MEKFWLIFGWITTAVTLLSSIKSCEGPAFSRFPWSLLPGTHMCDNPSCLCVPGKMYHGIRDHDWGSLELLHLDTQCRCQHVKCAYTVICNLFMWWSYEPTRIEISCVIFRVPILTTITMKCISQPPVSANTQHIVVSLYHGINTATVPFSSSYPLPPSQYGFPAA